MTDNARLVYSTEQGRIREKIRPAPPVGDGKVRLRYDTKGRKGKGMTLISGLPVDAAELAAIARRLKQRFGTGGAVKDGVIELQGDVREQAAEELRRYHP
ncbi:MAG TPA: stress response translation initiation inhibitor YciH [Candidatus Omnitrophota bacterium]|nr:stress response translation initiation inhibitor YciH [Candidatus Omnitrophota bacterium]HRZ14733.1 stress response translation initiation inhibitor YciH [Candidatus Omnitrophota bacterium]